MFSLVILLASACTCARSPAGKTLGDAPSHAPPASTSSAALAVADAKSPALMCPDDAASWVKTLDASHCETPRVLLLGGSPGCLIREPAVRMFKTATGEPIGFVHDSISSRSVYALRGFRSGDVWLTINGHRLTSPEAALEAHRVLSEAQTIDVEVQRGAEHLTLHMRPIDAP